MTTSGAPETHDPDAPSAEAVTEYLLVNPAFLDERPELLANLVLHHDSGSAVSLVERQLAVLRSENQRLKQQLDAFVQNARENDRLNGKIHGLVLALMNAVGPQAIFERLEQCLREDFDADHVATRVFAEAAFVDSGRVAQFVGAGSSMRDLFAPALADGMTRCGELDHGARALLFSDGEQAWSGVVMPLIGSNWDGVLIIASEDAERYDGDMATDFLTHLKDVVTLVIDPWVKRVEAE